MCVCGGGGRPGAFPSQFCRGEPMVNNTERVLRLR